MVENKDPMRAFKKNCGKILIKSTILTIFSSALALSTFTLWWNDLHHHLQNSFHLATLKPYPLNSDFPLTQVPATTIPLSVPMNLAQCFT